MSAIIDWISIALPHRLETMPTLFPDEGLTRERLGEGGVWLEEYLESFDDKEMLAGRSPYLHSVRSQYGGWRLYYGGDQPGCLLEISGQGCQRLREVDSDIAIVREFHGNITRIDIAVDIETDTDPEDFAANCGGNKFKSGAVMNSGTGKTVYRGSRKSDRYSRVYRYFEPHPRHRYLRVEMVCKGRSAKPTAAEIARGVTLEEMATGLGNTYGWQHDCWTFRGETTVPAAARRYKGAGTDNWMLKQVLPAARKMAAKGNTEVLTYIRDQLTMLISTAGKEG